MKDRRFLVLISVFVFAVYACGSGASGAQESTSVSGEEQAGDGKKIYKQYCVSCHGLYGDIGANGAVNLANTTLAVEDKIAVITKGRNAMTPFENLLSAEEIKAVADYTEQLKK